MLPRVVEVRDGCSWRVLVGFLTNMEIYMVPRGSVSVNPSAIFWEKREYALTSKCDLTRVRRGSLWLWGVPGMSTLSLSQQGPAEGTGKGQALCCCTRSDYSSSIKTSSGHCLWHFQPLLPSCPTLRLLCLSSSCPGGPGSAAQPPPGWEKGTAQPFQQKLQGAS